MAAVGVGLPHIAYAFTGSVELFVAGTALSGLFFVTLPLAFAYVADTVPSTSRATAIGALMAMFGLSMATGPLIGGILASVYGTRSVFWLSTLLTAIAILYSLVVLPESLLPSSIEESKSIDWSKANPVAAVRGLATNALLKRLALVALLYYLSLWTVISQVLLYARSVAEAVSQYRSTFPFLSLNASLPLSFTFCLAVSR